MTERIHTDEEKAGMEGTRQDEASGEAAQCFCSKAFAEGVDQLDTMEFTATAVKVLAMFCHEMKYEQVVLYVANVVKEGIRIGDFEVTVRRLGSGKQQQGEASQ